MLTPTKLEDIRQLQQVCEACGQIQLKLNWDMLQSRSNQENRDFFYYESGNLIGFLGLYGFGNKVELCGMVHPDYRKKGIFSKLFSEALQAVKNQKFKEILLNAPSNSQSAKGFLKNISCSYSFSEYQMKWEKTELQVEEGINLRHSTINDIELEIQLDMKCFGETEEEAKNHNEMVKAEENQAFYIIEADGKAVGKMRVSHINEEAWIYGFAVSPEYQGKGIGRKALKKIVIQEHNQGYPVFLEVEAKNLHALKLYESCGFKAFHSQDYYEYKNVPST